MVISLRNNMFELADKLIGIYKTFDVTKTITINPNQMKQQILNYQHQHNGNQQEEDEAAK